jgi:hypothetical protein
VIALVALPDGVVPLSVGTLLALVALSLVLSPLISDDSAADAKRATRDATDASERQARHAVSSAVDALREIEFDRATGKLSDSDYDALRTRYTRAALAELRHADAAGASPVAAAVSDDVVEAAIRRAAVGNQPCRVCGPRPEPDAIYCSNCGRYLPETCGACGEPVELTSAQFCIKCGEQLSAA